MTVSLACWWNQFWEMRYKELQAKGEDTDNHDFKSEWIPHWSRRSTEIYEDEVKQKTQELLMKFGLLDTLEPKRADYPGVVINTLFCSGERN